MAPLEGLTLGQRQKYYNELVKQAIARTVDIPNINFQEDDIDNMIKIDMACSERNVDYILDVFKCADMLYVSRAINKSTWLITDLQYAHIINPKYLHTSLFPKMNAKAVTKLMLHIRLHLKDEVRVKAFCKYVFEKNPKAALRWLEKCPLEYIEMIVAARANDLSMKLLKRLCRKSINILRVFVRSHSNYNFDITIIYNHTKYFLKNLETAEEFLDIIESSRDHGDIHFNEKDTNVLMKVCSKRIKENFLKYYYKIDLTTFVKYIKADEIRAFLMTYSSYNEWKSFDTLTPFLDKLPRDETLDFLSTLYNFDYKKAAETNVNEKDESTAEALFSAIEGKQYNEFSDIYRWYRFAPFDVAFRDLKKIIYAESSSKERHSILVVLLTCANYDFNHVKTVLQYYHDKHINEPYLHKKTFINSLLTQHDTFRFDEGTWSLLNVLFHSLEVYIDSGNKVQECLSSIIVHNVLRDLPVHDIVQEKFQMKSLNDIKEKLNLQEKDKVFNYLYILSVEKLCKQSTNSETGMHEAIRMLKTIWNLLKDWDRVDSHYPFVIDKITEFGEINRRSPWFREMAKAHRKRKRRKPEGDWKYTWKHFNPNPEPYVNIPSIYYMLKSYRKELFENSLVLHASEGVLLNALKHDPSLLTRYKTEINGLRCDDDVSLTKFLSKLRIYWADSLATEWVGTNMKYLQKSIGYRALVRGIFALMPYNKTLEFIKIYAPSDNKVHWSDINETELSMRKHIAKHMHIVRPQLPPEVVLWYAKGDYLQYALLSLSTMFSNQRSSDIRKHIQIMLSAPVSLQKHGIRLAFVKYKTNEIIDMASKIWKKTRNSSIRAIIFTSLFNLLCKAKTVMTIKSIWTILSLFIDELKDEEKIIHHALGKVYDVPLSVAGDFYQKAFVILKPMSKDDRIWDDFLNYAETIIDSLDSDFVAKTLLGSVYKLIEKSISNPTYFYILSAYLLCSKDSQVLIQKYNNLLRPVVDNCVPKWVDGKKDLLPGIQELLECICHKIPHYVFEKKMTMPVQILTNIQNALLNSLCIQEHYVLIRSYQLTTRYLEILADIMEGSDDPYNWESLRITSTQQIAPICLDFIAVDEDRFFGSIYILFQEVLQTFLENFRIQKVDLLLVLESMLKWKNYPSMYLIVIELIPKYGWDKEFVSKRDAIKRQIYFHPSEEVTMHYHRRFSDKYSPYNDKNNENDDDDDETEDSEDITDTEQANSENESHDECEDTPVRTSNNNAGLFGKLCNIM